MAFDRRFWSGAAITVTVVVAGANALPALLLSSPEDSPSVAAIPLRPVEAMKPVIVEQPAPAPVEQAAAQPQAVPMQQDVVAEPAAPVREAVAPGSEPAPVAASRSTVAAAATQGPAISIPATMTVAEATPAAAAPKPVATAPKPVAAAPKPVAAAPTPVATADKAVTFPPVQPPLIETETRAPTASVATALPTIVGIETPARTAEPKERRTTRSRSARPAVYPIREFLAWRR